ncbi:hypothetical protein [Brevibacillus choshinensis]|uniref:Uncharacterized protein n=1 Tax=Brevibacillus choshinensis TaxID=54911 RepID=A0ABX7FL97_BRECH|nr:hypothetical protein [Brevibacillus choshinensis]QRG66917.1 hypothetical protein JNE38_26135 [Brevibacillus choshinensis]
MAANQRDIKSLQLFQITRQQYIAYLIDSLKQLYREKHKKEPSKEVIDTFIAFLEKETALIDKMVESAFEETMEFMKGTPTVDAIAASISEEPQKKKTNLFVDKFREVVILPFLLAGLTYAITQKDWIMTGILVVLAILLGLLWWKGKEK